MNAFDPASVELLLPRFARHFTERPGDPVFKFLGETTAESWTYGDLDRRSRAAASAVRKIAKPGERALLLYPQGLEFIAGFLGCLRAGVIAVPAYPPRKNRRAERLIGIVEDCAPTLVLTAEAVWSSLTREVIDFGSMPVLSTDLQSEVEEEIGLPTIEPETIAYLQYTSGSTGTPKGVVITHRALAWNINQIAHAVGVSSGWVVVSWLPMYHDMGLVGCVLCPAYLGGRAVLMAPAAFLRNPYTWLKTFTEERGTFSACPNFGFDLCAGSITEEEKRTLDLKSLRLIVNAAEPVRADTIDAFLAAFGGCGFEPRMMFPCFGLAEATLFVSGGPAGMAPRRLCVEAAALESDQAIAAEPASGKHSPNPCWRKGAIP
jgi:acyl-CoA synthetase (AMP-forming)/AMP-acid ligase II